MHAVVCSAYMHTISITPGCLLLRKAWWISGCPIWAVMIKRKGSKVKNTGFFLQRQNLVVMALCTVPLWALQWLNNYPTWCVNQIYYNKAFHIQWEHCSKKSEVWRRDAGIEKTMLSLSVYLFLSGRHGVPK